MIAVQTITETDQNLFDNKISDFITSLRCDFKISYHHVISASTVMPVITFIAHVEFERGTN